MTGNIVDITIGEIAKSVLSIWEFRSSRAFLTRFSLSAPRARIGTTRSLSRRSANDLDRPALYHHRHGSRSREMSSWECAARCRPHCHPASHYSWWIVPRLILHGRTVWRGIIPRPPHFPSRRQPTTLNLRLPLQWAVFGHQFWRGFRGGYRSTDRSAGETVWSSVASFSKKIFKEVALPEMLCISTGSLSAR